MMNTIGEKEKHTQARVIEFFQDALGYTYLGNWHEGVAENDNIVSEDLTHWLRQQGVSDDIAMKAVYQLHGTATIGGSRTLHVANREVYEQLRYGVQIRRDVGQHTETCHLINWKNPLANDFGIAEEVSLKGENPKRPDLVLYINGIAIGVLELKRSTVAVSEGIRQNLNNQRHECIAWFFTTVQLVMAGNETQGLRYGVIETPEEHWLQWKEDTAHSDAGGNPLLRALSQICSKERLLEILHDFIVFDAGVKKICRHNQFFGVQKAQAYVNRREGGIIWHTQGSGKSLTMVWLARWIYEHVSGGRVLIITDRTELDEQIEKVFKGVDQSIYRTKNSADLIHVLGNAAEWLVCSLIHKFGGAGTDVEGYIADIQQHLTSDFQASGDFFVFVDECHRTQSGKLHKLMKSFLPNAVLIGFTGTPLLKGDKQRSVETFGNYIHTYKYNEAVQDKVVLDLRYEARDIDQHITSPDKIDQWFDSKTRGLTDTAKATLKQRWGTMQKLLSSKGRLEKIVGDILFDMETRDRLKSGRGNAILVSDSIQSACRFFELFEGTELEKRCAVVTSYAPAADTATGIAESENPIKYESYRKMLETHFKQPASRAVHKIKIFELEVKKRFIEEPGQMRLLIVVDKLLTGFDAPPATYLYIDKKMQDHGLFQAICRVNRLDGEDKEYGYIVDYKDLFRSLEKAIKDYTSGAFENYDPEDVQGLLKNRLQQGKESLDSAREAIKQLCEPVEDTNDTAAYIRFFCGPESRDTETLKANESKRLNLYKLTAAYLRSYAHLANEMQAAGYSDTEASEIKDEVTHYENVRREIKLASGDYVDLKVYEPAMRHLLDTYIRADDSETLSTFDDIPLVQLIVERGAAALDWLPEGIRANDEARTATIENNVRALIVDKSETNPKHYEEISQLFEAVIQQRKSGAIDYSKYLTQIVDLITQINRPEEQAYYPVRIDTGARRSFFDNLGSVPEAHRAHAALTLDDAIRSTKREGWRENRIKRREVQNAIAQVLQEELSSYDLDTDALLELAVNQSEY